MTFQQADFATAFQTLCKVVPTRTPMSILQNVKLQATHGEATLIATDLEVGIRHKLTEVDVQSAGEVLLPANRMLAILRELRGETIVLESDEKQVVIRADHVEYKLPVEDPAAFPSVAEFAGENYIVVQGGLLKQMIQRTAFATDPESTRYALGGVLMELKGEDLSLVATDTRRLALTEGKYTRKGDAKAGTSVAKGKYTRKGDAKMQMSSPIVLARAMRLIEQVVAYEMKARANDVEVHLIVNANDVLFRCGGNTIYSRLLEGQFPPYNNVLRNSDSVTKAKIDLTAGSFYSAVRQAQIMTSKTIEESRGVIFTFGSGMVTIHSSVDDIGQSRIELPISYDGPELKIRLDPRFVADFLKVLGPEQTLTVELIDSESAALFRTQDGYTYLVMPILLAD